MVDLDSLERTEMPPDEVYWNLTGGQRPFDPHNLGRFTCLSMSKHVYDAYYGPRECARCGHVTPRKSWWRRLVDALGSDMGPTIPMGWP